jgi:CubicO group peptidase (beta-lactamase class C family)
MPAFSNDFDMGFGQPAKWGLGFLLHEAQTESGRPKGSASWAGLFNSYFWIDRENDLCAVIGTQVLPFFDTHAIAMLKDFESAVYKNLK